MFWLLLKLFVFSWLSVFLSPLLGAASLWLYALAVAILIAEYVQDMRQESRDRKREAIQADFNNAGSAWERTDGEPVTSRAVTASGKPVAELRNVDLHETADGKLVVGELENLSEYSFDVKLRVKMKDLSEDVLSEETAVINDLQPQGIWRFAVPSPRPETTGFSLTAEIEVEV